MLISIIGYMGKGKTLSLTALGLYFSYLWKVPLFASYHLFNNEYDFEYTYIDSFEKLESARSGIVLIDELSGVLADSRKFKTNDLVNAWLLKTRKKNLVVFYTAQQFGLVDKRFRDNTNYIIYVREVKDKINLTFFDWSVGGVELKTFVLNYPKRFYNIYDTEEDFAVLCPGR